MKDPATALLTRTAALLLADGETTEGTRLAVERLARAVNRPVQFAARWGEYVLYAPDWTLVGEAIPTGVDVGRSSATQAVVDMVCAERIGVGKGIADLEVLARSRPVALARFAPMAAVGAAALGVIAGAPNWLTVSFIAASAACGALLRRAVSLACDNAFLPPFTASLLAGLIGGLLVRSGLPLAHRLVVVCPCMVLVPGPHFLNGSIDLVRSRIPFGAGRIAFALLTVLSICGGLLVGLSLSGEGFPPVDASGSVPLVSDVLAAGVAVSAYGSFFNMPWHLLPVPVVVGMAAHAVHWSLVQHGASMQLSAFGAALLVGSIIAPLAHRFRIPFGASAFVAVVSLMPGAIMFEAASSIMDLANLGARVESASLLRAAGSLAIAAVVVLAMTAGLILPKIVFDAHWVSRAARQR